MSVTYTEENGTVWERHGYCCHCGDCCKGCVLHRGDHCAEYGGKAYLGYGCNTYPSDPICIERFLPNCTYYFVKVNGSDNA